MEVEHDSRAGILTIKQTRYIDDVVQRFNEQGAMAVMNPREAGLKITKMQSPTTSAEQSDMGTRPYRSLIGCLLHIMTYTRPDVASIVTQLTMFLEMSGQRHWKGSI